MGVEQFIKKVLEIIPQERVSCDKAVLAAYAADSSTPPERIRYPAAVILPKSTEEVREVLLAANAFKVPIVPMSRGSNIAGLAVPYQGEVVLDLRLMNRIIEINEDAAYAVIEPGVTFHQIGLEARKRGFMIHNPTASGGSSVIANYLLRPSGCFTARWDPDPIIALEVVTPSGYVVRTGSASFGTAGWRSRYGPFPDLTGLFACSYGTLGVVTKASVKLYDRGEYEKVLITRFDSLSQALEYMKLTIRRRLVESVTFWSWVWNTFHTLMVSKAQELPVDIEKENQRIPPKGVPFGIASARLSGYKEVVEAQERVCIRIARELGGDVVTPEELEEMHPGSWRYLNSYFGDGILPKLGEESTLRKALWLPGWLVTAEPRVMLELEKIMWEFAEKEAKPPYMFRVLPYNHAREFFMAFVILITGDVEERREYIKHLRKAYADFYHRFLKKYGAVMFRFRQDPSYLLLTGDYAKLLRDIKKTLDPNNIMHPGVNLFQEVL